MRLVHFADVHLGFRQYDRLAPRGQNQRELDVERTFAAAIDRTIALAPDLVIVAGDVVHVPRPSNNAIVAMLAGFTRLTRALPGAAVIVASGNHDLSKAIADVSILQLLEPLGIHVAHREAMRFFVADRELSVLAVPDAPGLIRPALTPDPRARFNVLCVHGEVQGVTQGGAAHRTSVTEILRDELGAEAWDYCGFGHYHQFEQLAPNACYSGSLDYTSSNPWAEISTPKGIVERDLETGAQTFHAITVARRFVDLPAIDADGVGATDVDAKIAESVASYEAGIDDAVVRLVVRGISREVRRALDLKAFRAMQRRTLHFNLDLRTVAAEESALSQAVRNPRVSLRELLIGKLETRTTPGDVDRAALKTLALDYLDRTAEMIPADNTIELAAVTASEQRKAS